MAVVSLLLSSYFHAFTAFSADSASRGCPPTYGLAVGLPLAYGLNLLAASQLFGLNGLSWPMLAAFSLGILLVALLAALVPARRAMRSDPILALRCE
jgi:hypothetical protein